MKDSFTGRRILILASLFTVFGAGLIGCESSTETKQGAIGEFCQNRDTDCRDGFVCEENECVPEDPVAYEACDEVCESMSACGIVDANCRANCDNEISGWGESAIDDFAACFSEDAECEDLGDDAGAAANYCYGELELDSDRQDTCGQLRGAAESCNGDEDLRGFYNACIYMAKTSGQDEWDEKTDECVEAAEFGSCGDLEEALNEQFDLTEDEALDLGGSDDDDP